MGVPYAEVIGDPIVHSKSPIIHGFWLAKLKLDYQFRATPVRTEELADYLDARRADDAWCGCSITLPHKMSILTKVDRLSWSAERIGAVNCVAKEQHRTLVGRNTDWSGFLEPLTPWLEDTKSRRHAQVIGAGGAAAAVHHALDRAGFTITSYNRDPDRSLGLRRRLQIQTDHHQAAGLEALTQCNEPIWDLSETALNLVVNASPLGMNGFPALTLSFRCIPPDAIGYDLVYAPLETDLLREARARGHPTIDGLGMLIGQAAEAFEAFFAEKAPREHDAELRELLCR